MDLAALKRKRASVTVEVDGEQCTVGYHPNAVSDDDLKVLNSTSEAKGLETFSALVEPLTRMIVDWDITWDGQPLPVNEESISALPPVVRFKILMAIVNDFWSRGNAMASDAGSPTAAASEASALTTTASSAPPNGQASPPGLSLVSTTPLAG